MGAGRRVEEAPKGGKETTRDHGEGLADEGEGRHHEEASCQGNTPLPGSCTRPFSHNSRRDEERHVRRGDGSEEASVNGGEDQQPPRGTRALKRHWVFGGGHH
jgi:hypothetical protein